MMKILLADDHTLFREAMLYPLARWVDPQLLELGGR